MMKTIEDFDFNNKRVFLRADFNVPLKGKVILDDFKIVRCLPTIRYLQERGAQIIIASHLGDPLAFGKKNLKKFSLKLTAQHLERLLKQNTKPSQKSVKVKFCAQSVGRKAERKSKKLKPGEILVLENLRFHKQETKQSEKFAQRLAKLADVYVSEALSVCHRNHTSITILPKLLPHFAGIDFQQEYDILNNLKGEPQKPFVIIIGGAKVESKIKTLQGFVGKAEHILLGGKIANALLQAKGFCFNNALLRGDILRELRQINLTNPALHIPFDVIVSPSADWSLYQRFAAPANLRANEDILDIGPETTKVFSQIIGEAKTIFWAGIMGVAEKDEYDEGTKAILFAITQNTQAVKVALGGETIAFIRKYDLENKFSFLLTGGGASLSFLTNENLPGIKAMEA